MQRRTKPRRAIRQERLPGLAGAVNSNNDDNIAGIFRGGDFKEALKRYFSLRSKKAAEYCFWH